MYKKDAAPGMGKQTARGTAQPNIRDYSARSGAGQAKRRPVPARPAARPEPKLGAAGANRYGPRPAQPTQAQRPAPVKRRKKPFWRRTGSGALLFFGAALLLLIAAIILLVQGGKPTFNPEAYGEDSILPKGVSIAQVPVGELTVGEARELVAAQLQPQLAGIAFALQNDHIDAVLRAADLAASYDIDAALLEAIIKNKRNASYEVSLIVDDEVLLASVLALNGDIPDHAQEASFTIETDEIGKSQFVYTEGHAGMMLGHEGIVADVHAALAAGTLTARITPDVQVSEPVVTLAELKEKTTLLASYQTEYQFRRTASMTDEEFENHAARDVNITKALGMMNVIKLEPGYIFSFNDTTGKRSDKNGWALANAVYKDGLRKETGGGVCQITTTMFNALLRANIQIVNRKGHTIPSTYVTKRFVDGLGFDATVDFGSIDFKFRNNTDSTLYLFCYAQINPEFTRRKLIHIEVYGRAFEPGVSYKVRNEILEHIVADQPEEKPNKNEFVGFEAITRVAHDYYKVQTYVDKYLNGVFAETVRTEITEYKLIQEQRTIGTKPTPTPSLGPVAPVTPAPHTLEPIIPEE